MICHHTFPLLLLIDVSRADGSSNSPGQNTTAVDVLLLEINSSNSTFSAVQLLSGSQASLVPTDVIVGIVVISVLLCGFFSTIVFCCWYTRHDLDDQDTDKNLPNLRGNRGSAKVIEINPSGSGHQLKDAPSNSPNDAISWPVVKKHISIKNWAGDRPLSSSELRATTLRSSASNVDIRPSTAESTLSIMRPTSSTSSVAFYNKSCVIKVSSSLPEARSRDSLIMSRPVIRQSSVYPLQAPVSPPSALRASGPSSKPPMLLGDV